VSFVVLKVKYYQLKRVFKNCCYPRADFQDFGVHYLRLFIILALDDKAIMRSAPAKGQRLKPNDAVALLPEYASYKTNTYHTQPYT